MLDPLVGTGFVAALVVARLRPAWIVPAVVLALPLRLPIDGEVHLPTAFLLGAVAGRAPAIGRAALRRPWLAAAFLSLPLWMLLSATWARQPWFAVREAATWLPLALAALLASADEAEDPRPLLAAFLIALLPSAVWAFAEFAHLVPPLGDPAVLRTRLLVVGDLVRGRALLYHPTRLAEFVEQIGLLLVVCSLYGPWRALSAAGAIVAVAGAWASGSTAGLATMAGGALVVGGALVLARAYGWQPGSAIADRSRDRGASPGDADASMTASRAARRRRWLALGGFLAAAAAATALSLWLYYGVHRGLGPRALVYRRAWRAIAREPVLGVGGGNWPFEVAQNPMERFWFASHTHSLVLQLWVEGGAVAVVLAAVTFGLPVALAWRNLRALAVPWRGVVLGACAGIAGLLAHDVVHFFLRDPADGILTGVLLGVAASAARRAEAARGA